MRVRTASTLARRLSATTGRPRARRRRAAAPGTPRRRGGRARPPRAAGRAARIVDRHERGVAGVVAVVVVEALEVVDVDHRHRQRAAVAARAADQPGEPGEHVAAVEEAGQRVLVEHRLEPAALAHELLLERLGAGGGAHARDQLGRDDRLDQQVERRRGAGCPRRPATGELRRRRSTHDRGGVGVRVGLELVEQRAAVDAREARARSAPPRARRRGTRRAPPPRSRPPRRGSRSARAGFGAHAARWGLSARRRSARSLSVIPHNPCATATAWDGCTVGLTRLRPRSRARPRTSRCICSTSAVDRVEAPLAAQPGEEREPQLAVVEVAVEVEQVGLDEHAAAGDEGRAHADVGRGRPPAPLAVRPRTRRGRRRRRCSGRRARCRARGWRSGSRARARARRRGRRCRAAGTASRGSGWPARGRRPPRGRGCASRRRSRRRPRRAARRAPRTRPGARSRSASPLALWPKRKFSPTDTCARRRAARPARRR